MKFRIFDHLSEDPEKIFRLFEMVYGNSKAIRERWQWEFIRNPLTAKIRVFVAEKDLSGLAGMTIRMPCEVKVGEEVVSAFFATNSMVVPDNRGRGIIGRLYHMASEDNALHLSKGTAPVMYRQLIKMGYREISPNQYQVAVLAPCSLLIARLTGRKARMVADKDALISFPDFNSVEVFEKEHADLPVPVSSIPLCSKELLDWRYKWAPYRRYLVYERRKNGKLLSWCAMRIVGSGALLSDLRWTPEYQDEPGRTIAFSKALARQHGAVKLTAWFGNCQLRKKLKENRFVERQSTPYFSFFSNDVRWQKFNWKSAHFSHGDGDTEYV